MFSYTGQGKLQMMNGPHVSQKCSSHFTFEMFVAFQICLQWWSFHLLRHLLLVLDLAFIIGCQKCVITWQLLTPHILTMLVTYKVYLGAYHSPLTKAVTWSLPVPIRFLTSQTNVVLTASSTFSTFRSLPVTCTVSGISPVILQGPQTYQSQTMSYNLFKWKILFQRTVSSEWTKCHQNWMDILNTISFLH